jgi:hypothetical protein
MEWFGWGGGEGGGGVLGTPSYDCSQSILLYSTHYCNVNILLSYLLLRVRGLNDEHEHSGVASSATQPQPQPQAPTPPKAEPEPEPEPPDARVTT